MAVNLSVRCALTGIRPYSTVVAPQRRLQRIADAIRDGKQRSLCWGKGCSNLCRILGLADLALNQRHSVGYRGPGDAGFALRVADDGFELADRLVVPDVLDSDTRGNCLSDADGLHEPPVRLEEHRAGSREILGDNGIQETGRDPALYDEAAER